ncbi:MAG: invasin domain 3-containing protein [Gaiellaceae bacterium]
MPGSPSHQTAQRAAQIPVFVANQLGAPRSSLPTVSRPAYRSSSRVTRDGLQVRLGGSSVSLSSTDGARGRWTPYAGGAARPTRFGQELVTVGGGGAEQLLQVDRHQGERTWSWRLGTSLKASLRRDGMVAFRGPDGRDTGLRITPVELFDTHGAAVTPKGLRWSLARREGSQFLELQLDDSSLSVPYLIDPQVGSVTFVGSSTVAGATADWTIGFTTIAGGALIAGKTITVVFSSITPQKFTVPNGPIPAGNVVLGVGFTSCGTTAAGTSVTSTVTITLTGASCSVGAGTAASLTIKSLTNSPQSAGIIATRFSVKTSALGDTATNPSGPVTITPGPFVKLQAVLPGETADGGRACGFNPCPPQVSPPVPTPATAGTPFSVTVRAVDANWNVVTTAPNDTVQLTSLTDPLAVPSVGVALSSGTALVNFTLDSAGTQTVTATDVTDGGKTLNTSAGVTVDPAAATQLFVYAPFTTPSVMAGTNFDVLVVAVDPYGNASNVTADTAVSLSASGTGTLTGNSGTITGGTSSVILPAVQYTKAESLTLTATRTSGPALATSVPSDPPFTVGPGAATKLVMGVAASTTVNAPLPVTVTAEDAYDNVATGYTGTVSLTSSDPQAVALPAAHTFTGVDAGTYQFSPKLKTIGSQTVSAGDGALPSVTSGPIAVAIGPASTFSFTGMPATLAAGGTGSMTVTVRDAYGNVVTGFTGTAHFISTDGAAVLPADYTFTGADAGMHTFTSAYTLKTAGSQTITATSGSATATSGGVTVTPGPATTLTASAAGSVALNTSLPVTVTARDAYGNVAPGYTGTVAVTSSDGGATLPASPHTYVAGDAGVSVFPVTFATSGPQTVTATDTGNGSIHGTTGTIGVGAGAASGATSTIGASPGSITANGSSTSTITVRLKDSFGTSLTVGGDTVALFTTGGTLSAVTDNHNGTYTATLTAPSSVGTGIVSSTVNGTAIVSTVTVTFRVPIGPASGATSTIGASPGSIAPDGSSTSTITVQLEDAAGNNLIAGGDIVALSTTGGTLSAVTDNHDGTYTATLTSPSSPGSGIVSGTVNGTKIVSTATVTFSSAPPPAQSAPTVLTCVRPLLINSDGTACVAPPPPPPPIAFVGSTPTDGAALTSLDSITLTANHMASWLAISVAGPDGGTTTIPSGFGVSYSQPFAPTKPGAYTLTATMDDGFNPTQTVTVHFTIVPSLPNIALPGKPGTVVSPGGITVNWGAGTFSAPARVSAEDDPTVGGIFGNGGRVVRVTVTNLADGTAFQSFDQPLELVFGVVPAGVPSFSEDGISWSPVPELSSEVLPSGQADGYFIDSAGVVHLLTRHLTFFGVLTPRTTKLVLTVNGSVVRMPGGARRISLTVHVTTHARVVATLYSPYRRLVKTWSRTVPAGSSTLELILPAAEVYRGICTIVLHATARRQTTRSSIRVRLR